MSRPRSRPARRWRSIPRRRTISATCCASKAAIRCSFSTAATGNGGRTLASGGKRSLSLTLAEQTRPQTRGRDLHYLFAPLKHARLDYMVQKAVEMGASRLQPVLTRHGQVTRVNLERMRANAIEAAEQCGILTLPDIGVPLVLRPGHRCPGFRSTSGVLRRGRGGKDPVAALAAARPAAGAAAPALAVLVGPEGGFAAEERAALLAVAQRGAARARAAHPARRHRGGRGARAGRRGAGRLALKSSTTDHAHNNVNRVAGLASNCAAEPC